MRILLSGSTGLIGRALLHQWQRPQFDVVTLTRLQAQPPYIHWDPIDPGSLDPSTISRFDAVVHLAGEPLADERWSAKKKARIRDSRVVGTATLAAALARSDRPPRVFICASGINCYGDCGDAIVDESRPLAPPGEIFLADVCREWEAASQPLDAISRVVHLRIGMVLAAEGGPLTSILPTFRHGLGGPIAGGEQFVSWITLADTVRAIDFALTHDALQGPINVVAPESVPNRRFTKALATAVGKPAIIPIPGFAARFVAGEIAKETVLTSIRATPARLMEAGFTFEFPTIEAAFTTLLRDPTP